MLQNLEFMNTLRPVVTIFIPPRLTLTSSTFYPQSAFNFSVRTALKPAIMSLYALTDWFCNPDAMFLLCGTDCIFKHNSG